MIHSRDERLDIRSRTFALALSVLAISGGLAGCGSGPGASAAGDAAARFAAAVADGDGAMACGLLTARASKSVAGATDEKCEDVIVALTESAEKATQVAVWGDAAQATVGEDSIFLLHYRDGWLIDAAGCARTSDGPYDCKVGG
ncbi:MAG: hypothetical protein JWN61_482 [Pseudonocardiales bacterium]|nr:hypothetical protein [Pseudonocardiales bacterium]